MQQELVVPAFQYIINEFGIHPGTQGNGSEGLGLPPGENSRAMGRWQVVHFAPDGTDLVGPATIEANRFIQDDTPHGFFLHIVVILAYQHFIYLTFFTSLFNEFGKEILLHLGKGFASCMFVIIAGLGNLQSSIIGLFPDTLIQLFIVDLVAVFPLFLFTGFFGQGELGLAHGLNGIVGELNGFQHFSFAHFLHFPLDHQDVVVGGANNKLNIRIFNLGKGGIHHQLALYTGYPYFGNGSMKGDIRYCKGSRCGQACKCIGRCVRLGRHEGDIDKCFRMVIIGEQGTQGPVHQPGNKDLVIGRPCFASQESSREFTQCGVFFFIIH